MRTLPLLLTTLITVSGVLGCSGGAPTSAPLAPSDALSAAPLTIPEAVSETSDPRDNQGGPEDCKELYKVESFFEKLKQSDAALVTLDFCDGGSTGNTSDTLFSYQSLTGPLAIINLPLQPVKDAPTNLVGKAKSSIKTKDGSIDTIWAVQLSLARTREAAYIKGSSTVVTITWTGTGRERVGSRDEQKFTFFGQRS